jgi:lipid-binding SYLF domain-containing protein
MHIRSHRLGIAFSLLLIVPLAQAFAAKGDAKYEKAIKNFKANGECRKFFDNSYGYAVFPSVGSGSVGVGGAHGKGRVYQGGKYVGDTELSQLSVGLQLGGKSFSEIVFFEHEAAFDEFTNGSFEFGAGASVLYITAGASAEMSTAGTSAGASTDPSAATSAGGYYKGMATFVIPKGGLEAGIKVGGQKFKYKAL